LYNAPSDRPAEGEPVVREENLVLDARHLNGNIFRLALPAVGEMVLQTMVGVVDTIMIGQALGKDGVAAVALGGGVVWPVLFLLVSVGVGTTAVVARLWGQRDRDGARFIGGQSMFVALGFGLLLSVIGPFLLPLLLSLYRAEPAVMSDAATYMRILCYAGLPWVVTMVGGSVMRGLGDNIRPLVITFIANLLNVAFNYVFIYGLGPIEPMGVAGAALGSALSMTVAGVAATVILYLGFTKARLKVSETVRPDWSAVRRIFHVGTPAMFEQAVFRVGQMVSVWIVSQLGTVALAANQVGIQVESLSFMPGWGLALASTTLVGQYLGAGEPELAEKAGWRSAIAAVVLMGAMGVVFALFAEDLVGVFIDEGATGVKLLHGGAAAVTHTGQGWFEKIPSLFPPAPSGRVLPTGAMLITIAALEQPALAIMMPLTGGLRGAGDTRWTLALAVIGFWGLRIPFSLLAVFVFKWGIVGFWALSVLAFYIRAGLAYGRFSGGKWKRLKV
jgi:putative MATE family efflux protein